jgi:hypothetical protein
MEPDSIAQSDGKQSTKVADLRTELRTNLGTEFERALSRMASLTDEQRQALFKLVTDERVTEQAILKALAPTKKSESNG